MGKWTWCRWTQPFGKPILLHNLTIPCGICGGQRCTSKRFLEFFSITHWWPILLLLSYCNQLHSVSNKFPSGWREIFPHSLVIIESCLFCFSKQRKTMKNPLKVSEKKVWGFEHFLINSICMHIWNQGHMYFVPSYIPCQILLVCLCSIMPTPEKEQRVDCWCCFPHVNLRHHWKLKNKLQLHIT